MLVVFIVSRNAREPSPFGEGGGDSRRMRLWGNWCGNVVDIKSLIVTTARTPHQSPCGASFSTWRSLFVAEIFLLTLFDYGVILKIAKSCMKKEYFIK